MLSPITPPPSPILGAGREGCKRIWVTREVEQKYERIPLDTDKLFQTRLSNNTWKLCYVATDEIEPEDSDWAKIASTPGIYVLGKRLDRFYEVVVDESYVPWLLHHKFRFLDKAQFEFQFCYDPTQPTEGEVKVYGVLGARRRSYVHFLENAFEAIWSRCSRGLELCLRSIVPPYLQTALEWAILSRDILTSRALVQKKFTLCLVLLALRLLKDYNTPSAVQLLEKDQDGVLQAFGKDPADLFKAASAKCQNRKAEAHLIGLVRRLLILAGGPEDPHQLKFDQEYTAIDNLNLYGSLVGITGSNRFGNFDLQAMLSALSRSKATTDEYIDTLDIAELSSQMMTFLPIGFQSDLGLPTKVPVQLPLRYKLCAPSTIYPLRVLEEQSIKVSDITLLGDGVYELKKGFSDRKLANGDVVKLQLGGVVTGSTSQKFIGDANVCLPSPLKEDKLMTLFVDYNGWYEDHQGTQQRLSKEVLRVVQTMKVGQKVLIIEEQEDRTLEEEKEDRGKETRIWVVQVLQVLRVCAGHLSFGQNVAFHGTILGEKLTVIKRGVSQRTRKKLEEPRVECSACGLGRIFSFICCKFLGKLSNRGYVAL